jgi:hypothetical protein
VVDVGDDGDVAEVLADGGWHEEDDSFHEKGWAVLAAFARARERKGRRNGRPGRSPDPNPAD